MHVCASVYLLLVKCCVDIAMMVLCFFFVFIAGVWLCFFAALCKEDLNYSQPMNQLTLICPLLNLNPKKLFCLDFGLGRPLALSVGQLADSCGCIKPGAHRCQKCQVQDWIRRSLAWKRIWRHTLPGRQRLYSGMKLTSGCMEIL